MYFISSQLTSFKCKTLAVFSFKSTKILFDNHSDFAVRNQNWFQPVQHHVGRP